jgi:Fe-S-cluster containining protein
MLKKILSPEKCGKCRVCCGFDESDKWEIPLVFADLKDYVEKNYDIKLVPRGQEFVFDMKFNGEELVYCPMVGENGCVLGDRKPFDCRIWPFRVNELNGKRVITVSPVCEEVSALTLKTLSEFLNGDGFAEMLFHEADLHPDMVKPYIKGYPILAVE